LLLDAQAPALVPCEWPLNVVRAVLDEAAALGGRA